MSAIQGGCERISNTPIPFAYSLLLHRTVGIFCAIYPLLLINNFGY
nr:bestrophin family ion channel [Silvania hatchlandensis]